MVALTSNPYIPWDPSIFLDGILSIRDSIGIAFGTGFYAFAWVFGILLAIKIVRDIMKNI